MFKKDIIVLGRYIIGIIAWVYITGFKIIRKNNTKDSLMIA